MQKRTEDVKQGETRKGLFVRLLKDRVYTDVQLM